MCLAISERKITNGHTPKVHDAAGEVFTMFDVFQMHIPRGSFDVNWGESFGGDGNLAYPVNDSCRMKVFDATKHLVEQVRHSLVV